MKREKEPLYRKVNTKARGVHHNKGGDAKYDRNTKKGFEKMKQGVQRGLDYTPLYRFLLSKVGQDFDTVFSEAVSRLDKEDPIWHIVIRPEENLTIRIEPARYICSGESTFYSALYVDDNNVLQLVDPNLKNEDFAPGCTCCTHTFNGKPLLRKYINSENNTELPPNVIRI
jgi:hypothetical protein